MSSSNAVVVIRPYRQEDNEGVNKVVFEGTMDPVNRFFLHAFFRETFYQALVFVAALLFVLGGVKGYKLLCTFPIVITITYVGIWISHYYKAKYLHSDLKNILKTYLGSDKTCFFVAEAFYDDGRKRSDPVSFVSDIELKSMRDPSQQFKNHEIIGTVGLIRDSNYVLTIWLKRMAVKNSWRGIGVGSQMLERAIKFASMKGYASIELVTTECHDSAKSLYEKKGFEVEQFYHKKYLNMRGLAITMFLMKYKTRPYKDSALNL